MKNQPNATIVLPRKISSRKIKENAFAYLMLAPDVIGLAVFVFLPILICKFQ